MDLQTVVANVLTANTNTFVKPALQGLSDADLVKRPSDQCNPIGWLLWHATRVEDAILSTVSGRPQAWIEDKWHAQFGMPAEPGSVGAGDSLEQVAAFTPTIGNLLGYLDLVFYHFEWHSAVDSGDAKVVCENQLSYHQTRPPTQCT